MKITLKAIVSLLFASLLFCGCQEYDDAGINGRVDDLEGRVTELEKLVQELTSNLGTLVTAVDALENQDKIVSVSKLAGDKGWEIVFEKSGTVTVYNGANGKDGDSPVIGVRKDDTDGLYYWTLNDEWLTEDGEKIPATAQYGVPQIKIENGKFWFSTDGEKWTECGDVVSEGIGTIKKVHEDEDGNVIFTLYDDSTITIPKVQSFALNIDMSEVGVKAGSTTSVPYTITASDNETKVTAIPDNGYIVKVVSSSSAEGNIEITAPDPVVDGSVLVVAVNGKGVMSGKILNFAEGQLVIVGDAATVDANGGIVEVTVNTNLQYVPMVVPPADTWITPTAGTKALRTDKLAFEVKPNDTGKERTGEIRITADDGTSKIFTVRQTADAGVSGGNSDFETFDAQKVGLVTLVNDETTSGWSASNVYFSKGVKGLADYTMIPVLCGYTNYAGTLTSPVLEGGLGDLTVIYGTNKIPRAVRYGFKFKVEIQKSSGELIVSKEFICESENVQQNSPMEAKMTVNTPGEFKVIITNLCPSGQTTSSGRGGDPGDVFIPYVSWTGYSE